MWDKLPVEFVGEHVMNCLNIKDMVKLERSATSKVTREVFLQLMSLRPVVVLEDHLQATLPVIYWFNAKKCKLAHIEITFPNTGDFKSADLDFNLIEYVDLILKTTTICELRSLFQFNFGYKIRKLNISGHHDKLIVEELASFTPNIAELIITGSLNITHWFTSNLLSYWRFQSLTINEVNCSSSYILSILQDYTELKLLRFDKCVTEVNDDTVTIIARQFPKLQNLHLENCSDITCQSLITLSENCLSLKILSIPIIPNIPTTEIARRSTHALSCIQELETLDLERMDEEPELIVHLFTGLTSLTLNSAMDDFLICELTIHCSKLLNIVDIFSLAPVEDLLALCRANPKLQHFSYYAEEGFTDTALIELMHACPHLLTLNFPCVTSITDIGILALSENCPQLQGLNISRCAQITDQSLLALSEHCPQLLELDLSKCGKITDVGITALSQHCTQLQNLSYATDSA